MCLVNIKSALIKKIAKEDIVCYKIVLAPHTYHNEYYNSLYQDFHYFRNRVYSLEKEIEIEDYAFNLGCINYGFHSYVYPEIAMQELQSLHLTNVFYVAKMVKCIIPKGSIYYTGVCGSLYARVDCYVSNKIKIIEEFI